MCCDRASHSARTLRKKIKGLITVPLIGTMQILVKSWVRGHRARRHALHAARTLQFKIDGAVTAPFHGHQIVIKNGYAPNAHLIQHARYTTKSVVRSPRPSIDIKS